MSHQFETGMIGRVPAWHKMGVTISEAQSSVDALRIAGLDWNVEAKPIAVAGGHKIPGFQANVRNRDGAVLGVTSDTYKLVQPAEAFAFTDELVAQSDTRYETAGSLYGGKRIWLLASMPPELIAGSEVQPFVFFTTSFDGSTPNMAGLTPTVIVCANTLSYAIRGAKRLWTMRHTASITDRVEEAQRTLGLAGDYMRTLKADAETLRQKTLARAAVERIVEQVFPIDDDGEQLVSKRVRDNVQFMRDQFWDAFAQPDLDQYNVMGQATAWSVMQAFADVASHMKPVRQTAVFEQRRFASLMDGSKLLQSVHDVVESL